MTPELRVGVVDSGHSPAQQGRVRGGRRFYLEVEGLGEAELQFDPLGHGTAIIEAIDRRAPRASIYMAQVFDQRGVTSALQIAAAIHWLLEQDVRLINLSLGPAPGPQPVTRSLRRSGGPWGAAVRIEPGPGRGCVPGPLPGRAAGDRGRSLQCRSVVLAGHPSGGFCRLCARQPARPVRGQPGVRGVERAYRRLPGRSPRRQQLASQPMAAGQRGLPRS